MSHDMKPRHQSGPPGKGGLVAGLLIGLIIGAVLAAGFAWYISRMAMPFQDKAATAADAKPAAQAKQAPPATAPQPAQQSAAVQPTVVQPAAQPAAQAIQPIPLPGKPGDKVEEKNRFEFYKILPGEGSPDAGKAKDVKPSDPAKPADTPKPVVTTGEKPGEKTADKSGQTTAKPAGEAIYLQVGSFHNPAEADNLKARLALMGMEAGIQSVNIADKGTVHRVRLGPFAKSEDAAAARVQLGQQGISGNIVK